MLLDDASNMLTGRVIPFWENLHDRENGGYYGMVDFSLNTDRHAEKGTILNSRVLWFFSTAAMLLKRDDLKREAAHAYRFLKSACLDKEYGGVYWSVNYDGTVRDDAKYTYNFAFAVYALSAYYRLTSEEEALDIARGLYRLIEEKCADGDGYLESFDRCFHPTANEKLSEHGVAAEKTMNTLLHVFEAYSALYEVTGDAEVAQKIRKILNIFLEKVYHPSKRRLEVFFDAHMNSLLDLHSYGHDMEASWLLDRGCGLLKDKKLSRKVSAMTSQLTAQVYREGYHRHSLWNECCRGEEDKMRVWWVQAEAVTGFLHAYRKEPDCREYRQAAADVWNYIETYLVDPRPGSEWFWQVDDDGHPDSRKPIVEPWKCPYHNGRMCLGILAEQAGGKNGFFL